MHRHIEARLVNPLLGSAFPAPTYATDGSAAMDLRACLQQALVLAPGERFEYTSGVPLPTSSGFMTGSYQMVDDNGEQFDIAIPTFSLDSPNVPRTLN